MKTKIFFIINLFVLGQFTCIFSQENLVCNHSFEKVNLTSQQAYMSSINLSTSNFSDYNNHGLLFTFLRF